MADNNGTSPGTPQQIGPPLDQLSQLLMALPRQSSPLAGLTPNPAPMPVLQGSTPDLEQRAAQPRSVPVAQAPQPSDDPAITSARAGLDRSAQQAADLQSRIEGTQAKLAAYPPVDPSQYKPKWYDRLLGAGVGFAGGYGRGNEARGIEMGKEATFRRLNAADAARERSRSPLLEQLRAQREEIPVLNMGAEAAQRQFTAARDVAGLNQKEEAVEAKAQYEKDIADVRRDLEKATESRDANKQADALQRLTEIERNLQREQSQGDWKLSIAQQLADLKEQTGGKAKPAQSLAVQNKRDAGWGRARREYDSAVSKLDPKDKEGMKAAQEDYYGKLQDAQDEYEQGIGVLGGSAEHVELPRNHFGEQPASTASPAGAGAAPTKAAPSAKGDVTPTAAQWKNPSKGLRIQQPSGAVQVWKLEGGKPVLVSTEKPGGKA